MIESLICMATAIYFEARSEPVEGQIAVGHVIMNRVNDRRYPDNICDVVKQGRHWNGFPLKYQCQFTFWCDGKSENVRDLPAYQQAMIISVFLTLKILEDPTHGATHYHADYVAPDWGFKKTITIGRHIFYGTTGASSESDRHDQAFAQNGTQESNTRRTMLDGQDDDSGKHHDGGGGEG